jgi:hypothetical protein
MSSAPKRDDESPSLKGWQQIAQFLGQPISVTQRWAKSGMPVIHEGRRVYASPEQLNQWLGRESAGEPVRIAHDTTDLSPELKRGLSYIRKHVPIRKKKITAA